MTITGTITQFLPMESGTGSKGEWKKMLAIIKTPGDYPKNVAVTFWNDLAEQIADHDIGDSVEIGVNVESREYKERWYTEIRAWKIMAGQEAKKPQAKATPQPKAEQKSRASDDDDLPF